MLHCSWLLLASLLVAPSAVAKKNVPNQIPAKAAAPAAVEARLPIGFVTLATERPPQLAFYLEWAVDGGLQGARLAIADNNTTGRFTRQVFELRESVISAEGNPTEAFRKLVADGVRFIIVDLPAEASAELARLPEAAGVLIFNAGSRDDALRAETCAANLLHTLPSRAMLADGLAQYLNKKRWKNVFIAVGNGPEDRLYAEAFKRSAKLFGLKVVAEKPWNYQFDDRRTPESEVPVFTQGVDYDVLVVADESGNFGQEFPYRTWNARPIAGTAGLTPTTWHYSLENWGAIQLQNRFRAQAGRWMQEHDYAAWLAVRAVGEAATRSRSVNFDEVSRTIRAEGFTLGGFKGVPVSFRAWDGQMRQPVLLVADGNLVAVAPIEGFIHPRNELDSLGIDQPESRCRAFGHSSPTQTTP